MKWEKPTGPVQMSSDGRYTIQHATETNWVAYVIPQYGKPQDLGARDTDIKARGLCEAHEAQLTAAHRRRA